MTKYPPSRLKGLKRENPLRDGERTTSLRVRGPVQVVDWFERMSTAERGALLTELYARRKDEKREAAKKTAAKKPRARKPAPPVAEPLGNLDEVAASAAPYAELEAKPTRTRKPRRAPALEVLPLLVPEVPEA